MSKEQPVHAGEVSQKEHEPSLDDVMLSPTSLFPDSNNEFQEININATRNDIYNSISHSLNRSIESTSANSSSTPKAAQQSDEFYESYDPSIGLHTAAVLGGILVWLVLYLIYRTKIRKWAVAAFKKKFGDPESSIIKKPSFGIGVVDSDILSNSGGTHPNAAKPLINPSIVIESSPPQSPTKSISTYDQLTKTGVQECLSPYSLPRGNIKDDVMIFRFPSQHHNVLDQPDHLLYQLPISEMDIPTATAQWVQKMPLAARSYQDYAGLVLNMQARKFLPDDKPGSCPLVNATPPPALPVLELSNAWNNSLPTLSSSVSDHLINMYESATCRKELKDLINAKRKLSAALKKNEYSLEDNNNMVKEVDSNRIAGDVSNKFGTNNKGIQNHKTRKGKRPPGLKIDIPGSTKDTLTLINNTSMGTSPVPLPVTPTVMIENSTKTPSRRRVCNDSNTSLSSSSSDLLQCPNIVSTSTPPPLPPPIRITGPLQDQASWSCAIHGSQSGCNCNLCFDFCPRCVNELYKDSHSGPICSHYAYPKHHQCSIRHSRSDDFTNTNNHFESRVRRHGSLKESHQSSRQYYSDYNYAPSYHNNSNSPVSHHSRSMSVHNSKSNINSGFHQRSLSADMSSIAAYSGVSYKSRDHGSTYSLGNKCASPNFLRVPDPNGNPSDQSRFLLDANLNSAGHYRGIHTSSSCGFIPGKNKGESTINSATQSLCHGSDRNISYYGSPYRPISPLVDMPQNIIRRHSSNYPFSGNLFCPDNSNANMMPRPSSSSSTYFYPIQQNDSSSTTPAHTFQPVQSQEQQQQQPHNEHHQQQQQRVSTITIQNKQLPKQQQLQQKNQQNHNISNHKPSGIDTTTTTANTTTSSDTTTAPIINQTSDNNNTTCPENGGTTGGNPTVNKSNPSTVVMETKL